MVALVIVLSVLLVCVMMAYCFQVHQSKELTRQLKKMNDEQRTQIVTTSFPTETNQNLLGEINRLILAVGKKEQNCQVIEKQLQELVSNVSHDLRTPLTAILGYVRLINSGEVTEEETAKYLKIIEQRAVTLQNLILSFYDISRLNEGKYQLKLEATDVSSLCLELCAELYDEFEKDGTTIHAELDHLLAEVLADRQELRRVYENLLQNAKKHGNGNIYVSDRTENGDLLLTVANDSPYIAENEISRVFERSYSVNDRNGNTGLGLSISKLLLEKMGHSIRAYYKDGKFTVQINFHIQGET